MRALVPRLAGTSLVGLLLACNGVLGINEASLAPDASADGPTHSPDAAGSCSQLTCDCYCAAVMQNCQGPNTEYANIDICKSMCGQGIFEVGTINDMSGNSLGCRIYHANSAGQPGPGPSYHCRHAGPLGGNDCGDPCTAFCALDTAYCSGTHSQYPSASDCFASCTDGGFPYLTQNVGDFTVEMGNSLNCRLWHLETAWSTDAAANLNIHCPHTSASGGGECGK